MRKLLTSCGIEHGTFKTISCCREACKFPNTVLSVVSSTCALLARKFHSQKSRAHTLLLASIRSCFLACINLLPQLTWDVRCACIGWRHCVKNHQNIHFGWALLVVAIGFGCPMHSDRRTPVYSCPLCRCVGFVD